MKKRLLGILAACTALTVGAATMAACKPEEAPETAEGELYRTQVVEVNPNVSAYLSFKNVPEGNEWGEAGQVYEITVSSYGQAYSLWSDGYWELEGDTLTLTAVNMDDNTCIRDAEKDTPIEFTAVDGVFTIPAIVGGGACEFTFDPAADTVGENEDPPCVTHVDEDGDGKCDACGEDMPEEPDVPDDPTQGEPNTILESPVNEMGMQVRIDLYNGATEAENVWELYIIYTAGMDYMYALGGSFTMAEDFSLTLTVTDDQANMAANDVLTTVAVDISAYPVLNYSCDVTLTIPQAGDVTFSLVNRMEQDTEEHYTVTFDWNYEGAETVQLVTETFTDDDGTKYQYIDRQYDWEVPAGEELALAVPEREGYRFAGWDTSPNPVLKDGASETEYFLGKRLSDWYPSEEDNYVCPITEDTTIYARWVQPTHITNEEELRAISEDLGGWYILDNDITLTEEWTPVGKYYTVYEYIDSSWWKYAFDGIFDGNGHTISGLTITTLKPFEDVDVGDIGNANGTVAMFGAVAKGTIQNVTLAAPRITIVDYEKEHHAYVSTLVAFTSDSSCLFENCHVTDAVIDVSLTDIDYVAVAGMIAGHWGGNLVESSFTGTIKAEFAYTAEFAYAAPVNIFVGGLAGENYENLNYTTSDADIEVTVSDVRAAADIPEGAVINLYAGGAGGSTAYTGNVTAQGTLSVDTSAVAENGVAAFVGGLGGVQKFGQAKNNTVDVDVDIITGGKAAQSYTLGSVLGGYDLVYCVQRLANDGDVKVYSTDASGVSFTVDGETAAAEAIGYIPTKEEVNAMESVYALMGVNIKDYANPETGEYDTIFGVVEDEE